MGKTPTALGLWAAAVALAAAAGCERGSTMPLAVPEAAPEANAPSELHERLGMLLKGRETARRVLEEEEAELDESYRRQDSIFAIRYPDGPRPILCPFTIDRDEAMDVVRNLDYEIEDLRAEIAAQKATRK